MDTIKHPKHYTSHPSGVECIEITKHMSFTLGNAMKYIWRCDEKNNDIEDLKKAIQYIEIEIERRQSKGGDDDDSNNESGLRDFLYKNFPTEISRWKFNPNYPVHSVREF